MCASVSHLWAYQNGRLLHDDVRDRIYSMHRLLVEVVANLQEFVTVDDVGVAWEMSIHQAHPVLELVLDTIQQGI